MSAALSFYINFALYLFWLFLTAYSDLNNQGKDLLPVFHNWLPMHIVKIKTLKFCLMLLIDENESRNLE